jgi:hypothetical protein
MKAAIIAWLKNRWAEPESRAAVGGMLMAPVAYVLHRLSLGNLGMAEMTGAVVFALPAPIAKQVLAAMEQPKA